MSLYCLRFSLIMNYILCKSEVISSRFKVVAGRDDQRERSRKKIMVLLCFMFSKMLWKAWDDQDRILGRLELKEWNI